MSFIKKAMANVFGVGGAKVDTVLTTKTSSPGSKVEGYVNVYGGEVTQQVKSIYIDVKTTYEKESDDKITKIEALIQRYTIEFNQEISQGQEVKIPFSFDLDKNCPLTKHKSKIWINTRLDLENAIDNYDGDIINVVPNKYMNNILDAITKLGFRIREVENVHNKLRMGPNKFVQEFEYIPTGEFRRRLDELEVVLISTTNGYRIFLQVDRKVKGIGSFIAEKMSLDESNVYIDFNNEELQNEGIVIDKLRNTIIRYS